MSSSQRYITSAYHFATLWVAVLTCVGASSVIAQQPAAQLTDKELNGTWIGHIDVDTDAELILQDGKITYSWIHAGTKRERIWNGTFTTDTSQDPRHMTWLSNKPNNPGAPKNNAIYQFAGDYLLLVGRNRGKRPTKFYSGGKIPPKTVIFKRQAKRPTAEPK